MRTEEQIRQRIIDYESVYDKSTHCEVKNACIDLINELKWVLNDEE